MSANPRPLVATIYNPHTQSKDALIAGFTARKAKFDRLFRDIAEAPMTKAEQHYLIQGVRGMGKTTFLLRLAYEIENTPELAQRLIPIVFNEEEYGISSLADFWERTARYLEEADPIFAGLEDRMAAQYGGDDYERAALGTLLNALHEHNKKLILLIDNIGDLFRKFPELENKRLREVLLTVPDLRLIGATPTLIEQTHDYSKPYFEFFKVIQLGGLNQQETNDLFLKLGEAYGTDTARELVEKRPGRIEALRRLTGGVIRTMVLLFEIMVENNTGSVFRDLNALIDRVTPLYKHRIDDLPAQQQKIVAALANAWDAANTKELAQVVRLESKVVSAQLKQLINNGIVEKIETDTKNHLYRLEERFFNIWYLMRFGRKADERALWLTRFFETMFDGDNEWLSERIETFVQSVIEEQIEAQDAVLLTTAFVNVSNNEVFQDKLIKFTRTFLRHNHSSVDFELNKSKYEVVDEKIDKENYESAINDMLLFKGSAASIQIDLAALYLITNNLKAAKISISKVLKNDERFNSLGDYNIVELLFSILKQQLVFQYGEDFESNFLVHVIVQEYFYDKRYNRIPLSLKIIREAKSLSFSSRGTLDLLENICLMWCDDFQNINLLSSEAFKYEAFYEKTFPIYTKLLLAKKQYHTAYNYFQQQEWQLKDRFKPLYYATMYFLQDEYPTEYLRMGPELAETVQDILKEVEQMAVDYE